MLSVICFLNFIIASSRPSYVEGKHIVVVYKLRNFGTSERTGVNQGIQVLRAPSLKDFWLDATLPVPELKTQVIRAQGLKRKRKRKRK